MYLKAGQSKRSCCSTTMLAHSRPREQQESKWLHWKRPTILPMKSQHVVQCMVIWKHNSSASCLCQRHRTAIYRVDNPVSGNRSCAKCESVGWAVELLTFGSSMGLRVASRPTNQLVLALPSSFFGWTSRSILRNYLFLVFDGKFHDKRKLFTRRLTQYAASDLLIEMRGGFSRFSRFIMELMTDFSDLVIISLRPDSVVYPKLAMGLRFWLQLWWKLLFIHQSFQFQD